MLARNWGAVGMVLVGLVGAALVGCGGDDNGDTAATTGGSAGKGGSTGGGGSGTGGSGGSTDCVGAECDTKYKTPAGKGLPPPPASGAAAGDGTADNVMAVRKLFLGETDRTGASSTDAWKEYGFDLDGYSSDAAFGGHCKAIGGGKKADIRVDGKEGIDNSFGKNILPILQTFTMTPSETLNESIAKGSFTIMVKVDKLGTKPDYTGLAAALLAGSGTKMGDNTVAPTDAQWADGSYEWHPFQELLEADMMTPKVKFSSSYLVGDVWVSGADKAEVPLSLDVSGYVVELKIKAALVSHKYSADRKTATMGNIGGLLNTEELIKSLQSVAGRLSTSLCEGSAFEGIANQIRAASDIIDDPAKPQDPAKDCNAISIGLGFEAANAKIGTPAPKTVAGDDPCKTAM